MPRDLKIRRFIGMYDSIISTVEHLFLIIASLMILGMIAIVSYSVIGRFFFGISASWSVELSEYMMVYVAFLSGAWILKEDGHVRVEILTDRFGPQSRKHLNVAMMIIASIACILFAWFGLLATIDFYQRDIILMNVLQVPKYILLLAIPVGFLMLFLRFIRKILSEFDL